jgi:hypothetical protein
MHHCVLCYTVTVVHPAGSDVHAHNDCHDEVKAQANRLNWIESPQTFVYQPVLEPKVHRQAGRCQGVKAA